MPTTTLRRTSQRNFFAGVAGLAACCLTATVDVRAETIRSAHSADVQVRRSDAWVVARSPNFWICVPSSEEDEPLAQRLAGQCETLRVELLGKWEAEDYCAPCWEPACQIVVHRSRTEYLAAVGGPGRQSLAAAGSERDRAGVVRRRIDLRGDLLNDALGSLGHELTHLVVQDHFADRTVPVWAHEGMAILADPAAKQRFYQGMIQQQRNVGPFRLAELLVMYEYPPSDRLGQFYAESRSLVAYLVALKGAHRFVEFLELAFERGYDYAAQRVYGFADIGALERAWRTQALGRRG